MTVLIAVTFPNNSSVGALSARRFEADIAGFLDEGDDLTLIADDRMLEIGIRVVSEESGLSVEEVRPAVRGFDVGRPSSGNVLIAPKASYGDD